MFDYNKKSIIFFGLFCLFEPCFGVRYRNNDGQEVRTDINQLFRENQITIKVNYSRNINVGTFNFGFFSGDYSIETGPTTKIHIFYRGNLFGDDQFNSGNVAYNFSGEDWFFQIIRHDLTSQLVFDTQAEINEYFEIIEDLINRQHLSHGPTTCECSDCVVFRNRRQEEMSLSLVQKNFITSRRAKELLILRNLKAENLGRVAAPVALPILQPPPVVPQVGQPIDAELAESSPWAILSFSRNSFFLKKKSANRIACNRDCWWTCCF